MWRQLALKRPDTCEVCRGVLGVGDQAFWLSQRRRVRCVSCHRAANDSVVVPDVVPAAWTETVVERPGRSAEQEFERRAARDRARDEQKLAADAAWRAELSGRRPLLGRLVTSLTPKPAVGKTSQSTKAWNTGAEGERRVAEILAEVGGIEVLHDRLMPGRGAANIDHLVVGPAGVFVIDAKKYSGMLEVRDKGTWRRTDDRLYVGGRDRTVMIDGVRRQVDAVASLLAAEWREVPVHGVLCFVGCEWRRSTTKQINGVHVVWPKALPQQVSAAGPYWSLVDPVASHLRRTLRQPR